MLEAIAQGDSKAAEELLPLVYVELRKLAVLSCAVPPISLPAPDGSGGRTAARRASALRGVEGVPNQEPMPPVVPMPVALPRVSA